MNKLSKKAITGFTLVEILIALVLGLVITAGALQVYQTSKYSYVLSENLGRLQESARFAMNKLSEDIRMAGFIPCKLNGNTVNTLNSTATFLDFFNNAVIGYEGGVAGATPFPGVGTNPGDRVANTDAIIILRGDDESYVVTNHNSSTQQFRVNDLQTLANGDILLACDGNNASMFQALNIAAANRTFQNLTVGGTPGNCTASLGGSGDCADTSGLDTHTYGLGTQLVKFRAIGYYIGVSSTSDTTSLYRVRLNINNTTSTASYPSEELLKHVENLQILYGEDIDADNQPEQYFTANNVTTWNDVVNTRVGLLVNTPDSVNEDNDTRTYTVAGTNIANTGTTVTHAGDKKLRFAFNSTIKLRNRAL